MNENCSRQSLVPTVTLIGLGNIGSHVAPSLAVMPGLESVTLIDGDVCESGNLVGQAYLPCDVGKPKATVTARRIRQVNPKLKVHVHTVWVEDVPWAHVRAGVVISCVDSRKARQTTHQIAWRTRSVFIDTAVDGPGCLARVNVYDPGPEAPCMECSWNEADYAALEQDYPCQPNGQSAVPTGSTRGLGSIAGGMATIECQKALDGDWEHLGLGRQILLDLKHQRQHVTQIERTKHCRFDHRFWDIESVRTSPRQETLQDFVARICSGNDVEIGLEGHGFVLRWICTGCGEVSNRVCLERRLPNGTLRCRVCGASRIPIGFHTVDWLTLDSLHGSERGYKLSRLGFRNGDVVSLRTSAGERHIELIST